MKERPEFTEVVFHRGASETEVMARLQPAGYLGVSGFWVLDELRFVQDDAVELLFEQHGLIARQQRIGRNDQVVPGNAIELLLAFQPVQHEHAQPRARSVRSPAASWSSGWWARRRGWAGPYGRFLSP